ncbi:MAG: hypothetical protein ACYDD1_14910 [Caulobacteraceae bacterium]
MSPADCTATTPAVGAPEIAQAAAGWPEAVCAPQIGGAQIPGIDAEFDKAVRHYADAQTYLFAESDPPAPHRLAEFEAAGRALVTTRAHTPSNISFKLHEVLLSRTKANGDAIAMARQIVKGTGCDSDLGDGDDRLVASALLDLELIHARKSACAALGMPSVHDADWPAAVSPVSLTALEKVYVEAIAAEYARCPEDEGTTQQERDEAEERLGREADQAYDCLLTYPAASFPEILRKSELLTAPPYQDHGMVPDYVLKTLMSDVRRLANSGVADANLVALGEHHAELDAQSLAYVGNHRGAPDAEYVRTNEAFTAQLKSVLEQSLELKATTAAGLRAKALIASAWMPGEGIEEFDSVEWRAVWSLVNDALALAIPVAAA